MPAPPAPDVTRWLLAWRGGDTSALGRQIPLVYGELHRLAHRHVRGEGVGHTLQTAALVHEAFPLIDSNRVPWQNRTHFFAVAGQLMRRILVDPARTRGRAEARGRGVPRDVGRGTRGVVEGGCGCRGAR